MTAPCRIEGCDEAAFVRILTPFGTGNFCHRHARDITAHVVEHEEDGLIFAYPEWLIDAFRTGAGKDPVAF